MNNTILDQLIFFYYSYMPYQEPHLEEHVIRNTYTVLMNKGRILTDVSEEGKLLGMVESWRINYAQLGWIICNNPFDVSLHDINTGNICYVANTFILPEYRHKKIYRNLTRMFFRQNKECEFFIGEARRKKHQPFKVFRRREFFDYYSLIIGKGVNSNG